MSLNPDTGTLAASTASAHITTDNVKHGWNPTNHHFTVYLVFVQLKGKWTAKISVSTPSANITI